MTVWLVIENNSHVMGGGRTVMSCPLFNFCYCFATTPECAAKIHNETLNSEGSHGHRVETHLETEGNETVAQLTNVTRE